MSLERLRLLLILLLLSTAFVSLASENPTLWFVPLIGAEIVGVGWCEWATWQQERRDAEHAMDARIVRRQQKSATEIAAEQLQREIDERRN